MKSPGVNVQPTTHRPLPYAKPDGIKVVARTSPRSPHATEEVGAAIAVKSPGVIDQPIAHVPPYIGSRHPIVDDLKQCPELGL